MYSVDDCLTQELLRGGLACHHVPVDLRQAGDESSGLTTLTEAPQHERCYNSVRLSSFTTATPILCLR